MKFHLDRESFDQALTGELYHQNRLIQRHRTMHQLVNRATNIDRRIDRLNTWGHAILTAKELELKDAESGISDLQASLR